MNNFRQRALGCGRSAGTQKRCTCLAQGAACEAAIVSSNGLRRSPGQNHRAVGVHTLTLVAVAALSVSPLRAADVPSRAGAGICGAGGFTISSDSFGDVTGGAADCFSTYMKDLGTLEFEPGAKFGVTISVVDQLQNLDSVGLDLRGISSCWSADIDGHGA